MENLNARIPNMRPVKHNGYYCPWHGYQILAWILIWTSLSLYYLLVSPNFNKSLMVGFNIVVGLLYASLLSC